MSQRVISNSKPVKPMTNTELGMLVGLASFGMLFGTLILSYMLARARYPVWPPLGAEPLKPLLPSLSTLVLIVSSITVQQGHRNFLARNVAAFRRWWTATIVLGFAFMGLQT